MTHLFRLWFPRRPRRFFHPALPPACRVNRKRGFRRGIALPLPSEIYTKTNR